MIKSLKNGDSGSKNGSKWYPQQHRENGLTLSVRCTLYVFAKIQKQDFDGLTPASQYIERVRLFFFGLKRTAVERKAVERKAVLERTAVERKAVPERTAVESTAVRKEKHSHFFYAQCLPRFNSPI